MQRPNEKLPTIIVLFIIVYQIVCPSLFTNRQAALVLSIKYLY